MKNFKYFTQFILIIFLFFLFKVLGYKKASNFSAYIFKKIGSYFRSKRIVKNNLLNLFKSIDDYNLNILVSEIWENYGRIFSDYIFLKNFRKNKLNKFIKINGLEVLELIKKKNKPVIFISGHFNNFELMAMVIEKKEIPISAIYRPLNNIFLNKIMEYIRRKYICKNQIPKGISGTRKILSDIKKGNSIAIMIDQRVTEGKKIIFFDKFAYTTTIPAQLIKRFGFDIVPVHIERKNKHYFNLTFYKPISYKKTSDLNYIMTKLNLWLELMIKKNPSQWI